MIPIFPTPDDPKIAETLIELVDNEFRHFIFDGLVWIYVGSVRSLFHPSIIWNMDDDDPMKTPPESAEDAYDRAMGILK